MGPRSPHRRSASLQRNRPLEARDDERQGDPPHQGRKLSEGRRRVKRVAKPRGRDVAHRRLRTGRPLWPLLPNIRRRKSPANRLFADHREGVEAPQIERVRRRSGRRGWVGGRIAGGPAGAIIGGLWSRLPAGAGLRLYRRRSARGSNARRRRLGRFESTRVLRLAVAVAKQSSNFAALPAPSVSIARSRWTESENLCLAGFSAKGRQRIAKLNV
jgi:hypothetical protein